MSILQGSDDWLNQWPDNEEPGVVLIDESPNGVVDTADVTQLDRLRGALLDTDGLDTITDPEPLVSGILFRDSLAWLAGRPGSAKTFVALDIAGSVGTGMSWQGYRVSPGTVLYVIAEGVRGIRQRVRAWERASRQPMSGVKFLPVAVHANVGGEWDALCSVAHELRPALVVIDTQSRVTVGMEENSAKDMGLFVERLERLRRTSAACVLTLHHTPRSGDHMRGSTAMEGAASTIIKVVKESEIITLNNDPEEGGKQKDAEPFDKITLRLVPSETSAIVTLTDRPKETDVSSKAVRDMLETWWERHEGVLVSISALDKSGVCSQTTFYRHKDSLIKAGFISMDTTGRYVRYKLVRNPSESTPPQTPTDPQGVSP